LEAKYVYWLRPSVRESQRMTYGHGMSFRTETCRGDPDHAKRQIRPSPLRLVFTGGVTTDFMWSQYSEAIATPRVAEAFREGGVTGCKFVPVELENTMGDEVASEFLELRVVGWGGNATASSGIRVIKECPHCQRQVFTGYTQPELIFDSSQWDGSDVFLIWPLPRYILVTSKVANILERNRFSGAEVESLSRLPKTVAGTLTPGHLGDWYEDRRVREIEAMQTKTK